MKVLGLLLGGVLLTACVDDARVRDKGWREAITCVETYRSPEDCRKIPRDDPPYVAGWNAALDCMVRTRNLTACREPQQSQPAG